MDYGTLFYGECRKPRVWLTANKLITCRPINVRVPWGRNQLHRFVNVKWSKLEKNSMKLETPGDAMRQWVCEKREGWDQVDKKCCGNVACAFVQKRIIFIAFILLAMSITQTACSDAFTESLSFLLNSLTSRETKTQGYSMHIYVCMYAHACLHAHIFAHLH